MGELSQETELLVIGGGPGGYAAAFRAADLGMDVTLVEIGKRPGGVCLFRGCIPSKALLHISELLHDARNARHMGVRFEEPKIDLTALREWKNQMIGNLSAGLVSLTEQRGIQFVQAQATFENSSVVRLTGSDIRRIKFRQAVIATGSHPIFFPNLKKTKERRIMTSTDALELMDVPRRLLVIGAGYVGLELGSVYDALGSRVSLVELGDRMLPGTDRDLVRVLEKKLRDSFESISMNTRVVELKEDEKNVAAVMENEEERLNLHFDRALVAIGRKPNSTGLGLDKAGVRVNDRGFITVDEQQRTSNPSIFAIGDVTGGVMLAHKATFQGKIAAEVIGGQSSAYDVRAMPAVVFTDPQIAWTGKTEDQVTSEGLKAKIKRFPWKLSGRAASMGQPEGLTKMIIEADTNRILGVGIVGRQTEGMISEAGLAIEMGALADDVALTIHPHPTLSETQAEVAEIFLGSATHIIAKPS